MDVAGWVGWVLEWGDGNLSSAADVPRVVVAG
jgi:hypothetical protein